VDEATRPFALETAGSYSKKTYAIFAAGGFVVAVLTELRI
jgi:hypothetical protein